MTLTAFSPRFDRPRRAVRAAALAALLALGVPAAALAAEATVGVRGWDHGAYGRLVFDLAPTVTGTASLDGMVLTIDFSEAVKLDPAQALKRLARLAADATLGPDGRSLRITLKQAVTLAPQAYEGKLVLDLKPAAARPAPEAPPPPPEAIQPTPAAVPPAPPPARPSEAAHAAPAPAPAPAPVPAHVPPPPLAPPAVAAPAPVAAVPAPHDSASSPATTVPATMAETADVTVRDALGGIDVEVGFSGPSGAVVFGRGDAVFVVFDRPGLDPARLRDGPLGRLGTVEPLTVPGGSGFRLTGRRLPPQVSLDGTRWHLMFGAEARPPATPVVTSPRGDAQGRLRLIARVAGARSPISLTDPDIGDAIVAVPLAAGGLGVVAGARLPDLELLATVQGLAFTPLADGVTATVDGDEVAIGAGGGLTLSDVAAAPIGAPRGLGQRADPGLDVGLWNLPGDVAANRARLEREVALADASAKPDLRLRLGRYLVANGLGAEAIGLAALLEEKDPAIVQDPAFRLMRGAALAMQGRRDEALADLTLPSLEFVQDAALWRGYALAGNGKLPEAHAAFAGAVSAVAHYPVRYGERLLTAMGEAALAADDVRSAGEASDALTGMARTAAGKALALSLGGRVAVRRSDAATARALFTDALATGERIARVDAELGLIELGLADGSLTRATAIERLDRLRYAWRGDARELAVLRRLADLQLAEGRWRDGLETLGLAMKLFPKDPGRDALLETQGAAFRRLFLSGAADAMQPVQAVALYFDFRDLTPLGADGDEMIRRLADRLVQVDLMDQAKTLLTHQVTYRLQGIAKARVAARLALLHLLDRDPAKALSVLDGTEQPVLPDETARLRRLLRARALADLGRIAEAKALLATDSSVEAASLAAEIAWDARDWPVAADALGRLLADTPPPASGAPSPKVEAMVLRLAVARSLAGDAAGLKALADKWSPSMANAKSGQAFAALAGTADPAALATRNLAQTMANAGADAGFMDTMRQRLAAGELNAIN